MGLHNRHKNQKKLALLAWHDPSAVVPVGRLSGFTAAESTAQVSTSRSLALVVQDAKHLAHVLKRQPEDEELARALNTPVG